MKHILMFIFILTLPVMAMAEDGRVIELPGNAKVITGGDRSGNVVIQRQYGARDYIYDRLLNNDDKYYRRPYPNGVPVNDINSICGGIDKASARRECRSDVIKEQKKLYKKYN